MTSLSERCRSTTLLLSDVDGVMNDGDLIFDSAGNEIKRFHIRDGFGIRLWQRAGFKFGIVTGRRSNIVERRARELDIEILRQGHDDKLTQIRQVASEQGVALENIAYIGDDLLDLSAINAVGLGIAVADAAEEVRAAARYITKHPGGRGAVREVVEMLLRATGRWEELVTKYR
jgi:YrbI family 3-deoxy-D-manno-octulosonate 8-phosphate phosphatase